MACFRSAFISLQTSVARIFCVGVMWAGIPAAACADDTQAFLQDCRDVVMRYAFYRDRPDADAVANLFTADAQFTLGADVFVGREAIRARIAAGAGGPVFRHMMSTVFVEPTGAGRARGVSYVAVYAAAGELPITNTNYLALGEYHDAFVATPQGCRIAQRDFVSVFTSPAAD